MAKGKDGWGKARAKGEDGWEGKGRKRRGRGWVGEGEGRDWAREGMGMGEKGGKLLCGSVVKASDLELEICEIGRSAVQNPSDLIIFLNCQFNAVIFSMDCLCGKKERKKERKKKEFVH